MTRSVPTGEHSYPALSWTRKRDPEWNAAPWIRVCMVLHIAVAAMGTPARAADGYASVDGDTTGGKGGPVVTVSTPEDLVAYGTSPNPYVIQILGTINIRINGLDVESDKTIVGVGTRPTLIGEIAVNGKTNVIIHNLFIENDGVSGDGDGVRVFGGAHHVWVDHCTFTDCSDGEIDITQAADYVTISWCTFQYTRDNSHNFVNLIGASDSDTGNYRITFHHNWWSTLCKQRMPSQRFGQCHMYNNYFNSVSNVSDTAVRLQAEMLSENNFYENMIHPIFRFTGDTGQDIRTTGNIYSNCTGTIDPGTDFVFTPPYSYTLDAAVDVPSIATSSAGARSSAWYTMDAGGGASAGGDFAVQGTIGQADAGTLTGGDFAMRGGFWGAFVAIQMPDAPFLSIAPAGPGQATISWDPDTPGFVLQENLSLPSTNWINSPSGPTNPVTVPATLPTTFYRLFKP